MNGGRNRTHVAMGLGLVLIAGAACDPPVLRYKQFGACGGASISDVFFKFFEIDNSAGATSVTFDPYTTALTGHQNDGPGLGIINQGVTGQQAVFLGFPAVAAVTVAPGEVLKLNTIGVAPVPTTGDPAVEANNTSYFLLPIGFLGDKLNVAQTSWPVTPNCQDVNIKNAQ